jgi:hypothetical protein
VGLEKDIEDRHEGGLGSSFSVSPKWNISPLRCLNPLRFLVFDSETADEAKEAHVPLMKTTGTTWWNSQLT